MRSGAVICLQEVSTLWAGDLHVYFAKHGYYFITGLYGNKFNGYMGVGVAVPTAKFDILDADITKIADTKKFQTPSKSRSSTYFQKIGSALVNLYRVVFPVAEVVNPWKEAASKANQMVTVRLREKTNEKVFVVGTYHMPCMFKLPSLMMIHCALSAQHIQKKANKDPYVFVGDFNIKPDSPMYKMLTEGSVDSQVILL